MRPRRSSARWLLLALVIVPGCLFKPIFHPPSATSDDGGRPDVAHSQDASAADASIDIAAVPSDDCAGYYDRASGDYAPDAHHADGAICELPHAPDGGEDVSSASDVGRPDVIDAAITDATDDTATTDATDDTAVTDATDDTAKEAATADDASDEATDAGTATDDATPADPDAGE